MTGEYNKRLDVDTNGIPSDLSVRRSGMVNMVNSDEEFKMIEFKLHM